MNPFSIAYNGLWQLAEDDMGLRALVRSENRIKFDSFNPIKQNIADADVPELILVPAGGDPNLINTSDTTKIVKRYNWLLSTGSNQQGQFFDIEWALTRAMLRWPDLTLLWKNKSFVKSVKIVSITEGLSDAERNRGINGWSGILSMSLEMHFSTLEIVTWE